MLSQEVCTYLKYKQADRNGHEHMVQRQCGGLRHSDTRRKSARVIPDEFIAYFNLPNPSSRTMALRWTASNRNEYQESSGG
jgi:hypothetical protein